MNSLNLFDKVVIGDYIYPNSDLNLNDWIGEVNRIDFINKKCYLNLDKSNLLNLNLSNEKLIEYDKLGFKLNNLEIPLSKIKSIVNKSQKGIYSLEEINSKYQNRVIAKSNLLSSLLMVSITFFPLLLSLIGIFVKIVQVYIKFKNNSLISFDVTVFQLSMLLLLVILTGFIFIKGLNEFLKIMKLNTKGITFKSKIEDVYIIRKNNTFKYYLTYKNINSVEIHQRISKKDFEKVKINQEIEVLYLENNPIYSFAKI